MRSEEQWEFVGYCIYCNSPIYKKDEQTMFTGEDCRCELNQEENEDE